MRIKLGISTGFTTKRWANPKDWVRMVKDELGLDLVQFSFDQYDPRAEGVQRYCDRVRNSCEQFGVNIHSTFTGLSIYSHNLLYHPLLEGRLDAMSWFEKAFAMTAYLGVNATGGPIGGMDVASFHDSVKRSYLEQWGEEAIDHLLGIAKNRYGIESFYWEQTPIRREGTVVLDETRKFLERINKNADVNAKFYLCLDVGHFTSSDTPVHEQNPYYWIEQTEAIAPIIHLQQSDGKLDRHWPFTEERNQDGIVFVDGIMEALHRSGREEVILFLEIGHPFEEDDQKVKYEVTKSVQFWRNAVDKITK